MSDAPLTDHDVGTLLWRNSQVITPMDLSPILAATYAHALTAHKPGEEKAAAKTACRLSAYLIEEALRLRDLTDPNPTKR